MNRILFLMIMWYSCFANTTFAFDRQDSLRGSNGRGRSWWDVQHYALSISFDTAAKSINGTVEIAFIVMQTGQDSIQIDLQDGMQIESVSWSNIDTSYVRFLKTKYGPNVDPHELWYPNRKIAIAREENVYWLKFPFRKWRVGSQQNLQISFKGKPRTAKVPPWDGGFIWTKDSVGNPWIAVACQGLGASSWWPCKDYQGDEPNSGMQIIIESAIPYITNGMPFKDSIELVDPITGSGKWVVENHNSGLLINPINTYNATFYIGDYISWTDTLMGEKGTLDLSFHALHYNEEKARRQFAITKDMLHCFEYWMGPYPFYEDGYKLVEAPYLGMEHQSAIAYGNEYKMGYRGTDRSGTGVGLLFDYIIVHESGHEWFGNNITAQDIADNWLHEGFTTYSEALFVECAFGKEKAFEFTRGEWKNIRNDRNIIGNYGVNDDGSSDRYDKGSAVVHMVRTIMNDDEKFRQLLRGLNKDFYHNIVTTAQVENYINAFSKYNFTPLFNQYLRTTDIPVFDYYIKKKRLFFRFKDVVEGFTLPLTISGEDQTTTISPTSEWQSVNWKGGYGFDVSKDFLIRQ